MVAGSIAAAFFYVLVAFLIMYLLNVIRNRFYEVKYRDSYGLKATPDSAAGEDPALAEFYEGMRNNAFFSIGQMIVPVPGRRVEELSPQTILINQQGDTFATAGVIDKNVSAGLFTLFDEKACVESLVLYVAQRGTPELIRPDHRMQIYTGAIDLEVVVRNHREQINQLQQVHGKPAHISEIDDVVRLEKIYLRRFMPRRMFVSLQPLSMATIILSGFHLLLSLAVAVLLSVVLESPNLLPLMLVTLGVLSMAGLVYSINRWMAIRQALR